MCVCSTDPDKVLSVDLVTVGVGLGAHDQVAVLGDEHVHLLRQLLEGVGLAGGVGQVHVLQHLHLSGRTPTFLLTTTMEQRRRLMHYEEVEGSSITRSDCIYCSFTEPSNLGNSNSSSTINLTIIP